MSPRSSFAILIAAGLIAVFSDSSPAIAQDEPELRIEGREGRRESERQDRRSDQVQDELLKEVEALRNALREERAGRLRAEEERDTSGERRPSEPRDRPQSEDLDPRPRGRDVQGEREPGIIEIRPEDDRGTGAIEVAAAQVEAARAALDLAELRLEATQLKFDYVMRDEAEMPEIEQFPLRLAIAEARAEAADARARLIEAEFRLFQSRRRSDEAGEVIVTQAEPDFTVDDALETAEKVIDLLRRFRFDQRPR